MTDRFSEIKNILFDQNIAFELKTYLVLQHQLAHIPLFKKFATNLNYSIHSETSLIHYPYLPIDFFRNHEIIIDQMSPVITFESSGTTDSNNSKHLIADIEIYKQSILNGFVKNYGHPSEYVFWSLLPSYLERQNASLIYMVKYLMDLSNHPKNGFFRFNYEELIQTIQSYVGSRKKFIIGVSFALLDMAEKFAPIDLKECIIMETGGMKGVRKEILRENLHEILTTSFQVDKIHSEYGMTELLSQAYSKGDGLFLCSNTMKVLVRDPYDPTIVRTTGKGLLNIIDLANIHSCSFIATNDLGEVYEDGSFRVLGRMDHSRIRGCNLMFESLL